MVFMFCALALCAQAKKPIIMVIPSDSYCERAGAVTEFTDESGNTQTVSDFKKLFKSDEDIRLVVSEIGAIMAQRGFPLKDLEQTLKSLNNEAAEMGLLTGKSGSIILESPLDQIKRTAKADIIMDIDFTVKSRGPQKYVTFNLRGLDSYTNKLITAASGDGRPSTAATTGLLIEEAVLNYMDTFNAALQEHFNDMFANGREATFTLRMFDSSPVNFDDEFDFQGETVLLSDIIDWWMDENAVNHRFSRTENGDYVMKYEQVRIPLYKTVLGKERATDARGFASDLAKFLRAEPFMIPSKIYERGLGEVWLILGDN